MGRVRRRSTWPRKPSHEMEWYYSQHPLARLNKKTGARTEVGKKIEDENVDEGSLMLGSEASSHTLQASTDISWSPQRAVATAKACVAEAEARAYIVPGLETYVQAVALDASASAEMGPWGARAGTGAGISKVQEYPGL